MNKHLEKPMPVIRPAVLGVAIAFGAMPAIADDTVVTHLTEAEMHAAVDAPNAAPLTPIAQHDGYQAQLLHRNQSGKVEQHFNWNEYLIVQEGDATLNYGGTSVNAKEMRPGEMIGDTIANGSSVPMHKGDVFIIPAGTPHQMVLAPGAVIRYLDFKGRKSE